MKKIIVTHFHRKTRKYGNYSIEYFYKQIREILKEQIDFKLIISPYESNGIFKRLYNAVYAAFKQDEVNHITGDVNYLNLFFRKKKNIVTILDCGLLYDTKGFAHFIYKLLWFTIPVKRAKRVVAISQATKNEILKYVKCDPDKIKVIYVSVTEKFKRVDKPFNKEKPVILHIGSAPNKNLKRLIEAVEGISCRLEIVGKIPKDEIELLNAKNIDYNNSFDLSETEMVKKYEECDLLSLVSTYEGFGMPIVEANIVGRPVITSNLYSMPEVAGNAALLIDPYNTEQIRSGIKQIISDDSFRNELITNGFKNSERFMPKKMATDYLQLYQLVNLNMKRDVRKAN